METFQWLQENLHLKVKLKIIQLQKLQKNCGKRNVLLKSVITFLLIYLKLPWK